MYRRKPDTLSVRASEVSDHDVWNTDTTEEGGPVM